jgi:F0F1-type ATP synthase assembly protein I
MSERCRVSIMGKDGSLSKATSKQKSLIKACKIKKREEFKKKVSKKVTKGYQQSANFLSEQVSKLKK